MTAFGISGKGSYSSQDQDLRSRKHLSPVSENLHLGLETWRQSLGLIHWQGYRKYTYIAVFKSLTLCSVGLICAKLAAV